MKKIFFVMLIILTANLWSDFNLGKNLFEDMLYDEAINEFEKIIANSPTSDEAQNAMFLIGECYRNRDQFSLAEIYYKRLLVGYPSLLFRDKVMFYLANIQLEQKKYKAAIENYTILLEKYPLTDFAKKSVESYLQSIYESRDYDRVIREGNKLIENYNNYPNILNSYLWLSKAYFGNKMPKEGGKILNKIIKEFPNHIARWKALNLEFEIMKKNVGEVKAAELLEEKLAKDIPRIYEKDLRLKLVKLYIKLNDFTKAYEHQKIIINKYGNAEELDEYIILLNTIQLNLKKYSEIENEFSANKKVFKISELKSQFELNLAEAKFHLQKFRQANSILEEIFRYAQNEKVLYESKLLKAKLQTANGKYNVALKSFQELLNNENSEKDRLYFLIGNLYFQQFKNYHTALKYFQQVDYSSIKLWQKAIYEIVRCYEKLGKNEKAIAELSKIDAQNMEDKNFKNKLIKKKKYLQKFKTKNYEKAFDKLLYSMFDYFESDDENEFQNEIISIYIEDLKDYENGLALIVNSEKMEDIYQKAKIYLLLAEKSKAEIELQEAENYFRLASENVAKLSLEKHEKWITELTLKKELIQTQNLNDELIKKIEKFVTRYPSYIATNQFLQLISNYYIENNNSELALEFINKLKDDNSINKEEFYRAKIELAEYYYKNDDNLKALKNYEIAQENIGLHTPNVYFHYGVALQENGQSQKAENIFTLLLQNAEQFADYNSVISYFTKILMENNEYEKAIKFMLFNEERDDDFYAILADNYLKLNDKENAKESLMYIVEKNPETLNKLAMLQFETGDLEMAKYSFNELLKKDENNLDYFEMLGIISFLQEDFLGAASNYKKIVDKLGDNFQAHKNISKIAKENIISLYRIKNRPKAEKLQKKFKEILTENMRHEITLNEGIYYSGNDKKKAEKIFSKLLKTENLSKEIIIKSYYWRGLVRLTQKKLPEAKVDFTTVANSIDKNLSNQAHLKLGTINFSQENFEKALFHYSKVIENDEKGELAFDATRNFAYVCKTMKEWQKAILAYELILEKWGDEKLEAETLFDIAFCHFRDKKFPKAIEIFERTIPILKDNDQKAEAQYWIGESYFEMENYEKAISELLKVKYNYNEIIRWTASSELRVGGVYIELGKVERAKQIYQQIIDKYGKFSQWGEAAQKRLKNFN